MPCNKKTLKQASSRTTLSYLKEEDLNACILRNHARERVRLGVLLDLHKQLLRHMLPRECIVHLARGGCCQAPSGDPAEAGTPVCLHLRTPPPELRDFEPGSCGPACGVPTSCVKTPDLSVSASTNNIPRTQEALDLQYEGFGAPQFQGVT